MSKAYDQAMSIAAELVRTLSARGEAEGFSPRVAIAALVTAAVSIEVFTTDGPADTSAAVDQIIKVAELMRSAPVPPEFAS